MKIKTQNLSKFETHRIKRDGVTKWTWYDQPAELDGTEGFWCFATRREAQEAAAVSRVGKLQRKRATRLQYCAEIREGRESFVSSLRVTGCVVEGEIPEWSSNTPALHCEGNVLSHVWTGDMGFTGAVRDGRRILRRRLESEADAVAFADRVRTENSGLIRVTFAGCW